MAESLLCVAIRERVLLEFDYGGQHRVVAPYCHGLSKGGETLRAVQVRGETRSGYGFGKLWTVARMSGLKLTTEAFVPDDPTYNPKDTAMQAIHCSV